MVINTKIINTIAAGVLAFAVFLVPVQVTFAASFNDHQNDRSTLRVKNANQTPSTSGWETSVSADPGDTVSFAIYYHNTSSDDAENVKLHLSPKSTNDDDSHTFTATVSADDTQAVSGTATVSVSPESSLSFVSSSVEWYPNQKQSNPQPLPQNQDGSELFDSGLNIGTIAGAVSDNDFSKQGSVVLNFRVEDKDDDDDNQNSDSPTISFFASPSSVQDAGDVTTLFWNTSNADSCTASASPFNGSWNGSISTNGDRTVAVDRDTTFSITCQNQQGSSRTRSTSVDVRDTDDFDRPSVTTEQATDISSTSAQLNTFVSPNGSNTRVYFEWGPNSQLSFTTNQRHIGSSGSQEVSRTISGLSPDTNYFFRAIARNDDGITRGQILTFRTDSSGTGQPGDTISVVTNVTTEIGATTARINGLVFPNNNTTTGYFEWGRTQSLGNTTQQQSLGTASVEAFGETLSGLSPNTNYFYRAVARKSSGDTTRGSILSFRTNSAATPPATDRPTDTQQSVSVIKEVQNIDSGDPAGESATAEAGDTVRFFITVQNTGNTTLKGVEIHDRIPAYVEFTKGQNLNADQEREIVWIVGDMAPGEVENVELDVAITEDAPNITIQNVARVEADDDITQNSNTALVRIVDGRNIEGAAAAFFGQNFLPDTLLDWLIIVAVILALVLLFRFLANEMEARRAERLSATREDLERKAKA